jgi:hypothetical protein
VSEQTQKYEKEVVEIPQTTEKQKEKQRVAKIKGPKLGPLRQRFEMVNGNEI